MIDKKDRNMIIMRCKKCGTEIKYSRDMREKIVNLTCACGGKEFEQQNQKAEVITK